MLEWLQNFLTGGAGGSCWLLCTEEDTLGEAEGTVGAGHGASPQSCRSWCRRNPEGWRNCILLVLGKSQCKSQALEKPTGAFQASTSAPGSRTFPSVTSLQRHLLVKPNITPSSQRKHYLKGPYAFLQSR